MNRKSKPEMVGALRLKRLMTMLLLAFPFALVGQNNVINLGKKKGITYGIEYDQKGDKLALATEDNVIIYDAESYSVLQTIKSELSEKILSFNYYGPFLAIGDKGSNVALWEAKTGKKIFSDSGEGDPITAVKISKDSLYLAASNTNGIIKIWEIKSGKLLHQLNAHHKDVTSLSFSQSNVAWMASGGADKKIKLWDISTGQMLAEMQGHQDWVRSIMFHPVKSELASAGDDKNIFIWSLKSLDEIEKFKLKIRGGDWIHSLSYSWDGRGLAYGGQQGNLWVRTDYGYYKKKLGKYIVGVSYKPSKEGTDRIAVATFGKGGMIVDLGKAVFISQ